MTLITQCKKCRKKRSIMNYDKNICDKCLLKKDYNKVTNNYSSCSKCNKTNYLYKNNLCSICSKELKINNPKEWSSIYYKNYYNLNKNMYKYNITKFKYNLSKDNISKILLNQNNLCLICDKDLSRLSNREIHIDHNHSTGKVRGILCSSCNKGLGFFKDNIKNLKRAVYYLNSNTE